MQLLYKVSSYTNSREDLKAIYLTYIRSVAEQSAVVWHSGLTIKNRKDLERIQKAAVKVILGKKYTSYKSALKELNLDTLNDRRKKLCLKFAKKSLQNEKVKSMFSLSKSKHHMKMRKQQKFHEKTSKTSRYNNSAIPYMTRILNEENEVKNQFMKY